MRVDRETAGRIKAGQITVLILEKPLRPGKHRIDVERKREPEDGYDDKHPDTIVKTECKIDVWQCDRMAREDVTNEIAKAGGYPSVHVFRSQCPFDAVFVLWFKVIPENHDPLRLLGPGGGYTSSTFLTPDKEVEGVHELVQEALTKEAKAKDRDRDQRRRKDWERRSTLERLANAKAEAVARSIDISHHERVIADRVDRIERQLGKDKAA